MKRRREGMWRWGALVALRLALVLAPQTGYLHPDEFLQSTEVMAGEVLGVEAVRPWEWNATFPLRSPVVPQLTSGLAYRALRALAPSARRHLAVDLLSPYWLLVAPRLLFFCLSLAVDRCLFALCDLYGESGENRSFALASSGAMLTFACRTFSNSAELVLVSVLLWAVAAATVRSERSLRLEAEGAPPERVPPHTLSGAPLVACVSTLGVFNRPTFVAFAAAPVALWLTRGAAGSSRPAHLHRRAAALVCCALPLAAALVTADSLYYGYLSATEPRRAGPVLTPLNFVLYNGREANLAAHGLHPRWLHALVNLPLLFNLLGIRALRQIYRVCAGGWRGWRGVRLHEVRVLMTLSWVTPLVLLSLVPHQEPRFLLPLLLPLAWLHARPPSASAILCNLLLVGALGFAHQGGVVTLAGRLRAEAAAARALGRHTHVVTTHLYPLPRSLLGVERSSDPARYELAPYVHFHEWGSLAARRTARRVRRLAERAKDAAVWVAAPCTLSKELARAGAEEGWSGREAARWYPHASTEALPAWSPPLSAFLAQFCLVLYEVRPL